MNVLSHILVRDLGVLRNKKRRDVLESFLRDDGVWGTTALRRDASIRAVCCGVGGPRLGAKISKTVMPKA